MKKLVMQRYYILRQDKPSITPIHWYLDTIFHEIKDIWEWAYIPIVSDKACIARIKTVLQSWDKRYCRRMEAGSKQLQDYQDYLNSLCDLAPDNDRLLHILKSSRLESWHEHYQFYLNMKAIPQIGCMTSPILHCRKRYIVLKRERDSYHKGKIQRSKDAPQPKDYTLSLTSLKILPNRNQLPVWRTWTLNTNRRPTSNTKWVSVQRRCSWNHLPMTLPKPRLFWLHYFKVSTNVALTLFAKMINLGVGDVHDYILSRTTIWRQRIAGETQATWCPTTLWVCGREVLAAVSPPPSWYPMNAPACCALDR